MSQPVLEVAILHIRPGETASFEAAFGEAQQIISGRQGYLRHELQKCLEDSHKYLLLVWWNTLEAHTQGFRGSAEYQQWKALLHHFYEPFPVVEHFTKMVGFSA